MITHDELEEAEQNLESMREKYLLERGWIHTCAFPDCCWRWEKALKYGRRVSVSLHDALSIQNEMDEDKP